MRAFVLKHIGLIAGVFIFSSLSAIMETVGLAAIAPLLSSSSVNAIKLPFLFSQAFQFLNNLPLSAKLAWIAFIIISSTIVKNVFFYLNISCCNIIRSALIKHYRMACIQSIMNVGVGYLNKKRAADIKQVFELYIDNHIGPLVDIVGSIQPYVFTLLFLTYFLFSLSVKLTLLSVGLVAVSLGVLSFVSMYVRRCGEQWLGYSNHLSRILMDTIQGMKIIRIFGREDFMVAEYEKANDVSNRGYEKVNSATSLIGPIFEICGGIILGAILLAVSWMMIKDPTVYNILLVFVLIWVRIIPPVKSINQARGAVVARLPALREVNKFLDETKTHVMPNGTAAFVRLNDRIEFKNVRFQYAEGLPIVLENISFVVPRGKRVGIIGYSGSGKSTLAELLLRAYDPQAGDILIDQMNLKDFEIKSWRKAVGVVSQDTFLFHESIRYNIMFAHPGASEDMMIKAAKRAHAHEFIEALPQGYDTRVGDRGVLLSGGQRQRIAIARAILNEPEILIFDEATSALDSESEQYVQEALDDVSKEKTVITIAHRLSTVMNSDWIIVLDKGHIIEQGTSQQLLSLNGTYKKLVEMQTLDLK